MARKNGLLIPMLCVNIYFGAGGCRKKASLSRNLQKSKVAFPQQSESVEIR